MGRVITPVTVQNLKDQTYKIICDCLVDTASAYLVMPSKWKVRLGELDHVRDVIVQLGDQTRKNGEVYGPVRIQVEGFPSVYSELLFIDMDEHEGSYEPLLGYIPLEQSQAAVDMVGHRLVPVKTVDLKSIKIFSCP